MPIIFTQAQEAELRGNVLLYKVFRANIVQ